MVLYADQIHWLVLRVNANGSQLICLINMALNRSLPTHALE